MLLKASSFKFALEADGKFDFHCKKSTNYQSVNETVSIAPPGEEFELTVIGTGGNASSTMSTTYIYTNGNGLTITDSLPAKTERSLPSILRAGSCNILWMFEVAWELGIGSTWIMHFIPEAVMEEFDLPDNVVPVCILVMGYPAQEAVPSALHSRKKDLKDMVTVL